MLNVSALSIAPLYFRSLQCFSSAVNDKYMPFWRHSFADTGPRHQHCAVACRVYTRQVPQLNIEVQADDIWTELCRTNRLPVTDVQSCKEIIKFLLTFQYHKNHIVHQLADNTILLKFPVNRWKETASDLLSCGFKRPHILPLLAGCHALLHGTAWNTLQEVLMFLQGIQIPYSKRLQVIVRNPGLLQSDDMKPIMQNYSNLLKIFTKNDVQTLIAKCPALLTDLVKETNKKIDYLYNEMGVRSQEITRSEVFQYSLVHIMTRHQFAERAGVYKMPDKHEIAAKEMNLKTVTMSGSGNPSLSDLVDTSKATFVHSFCSMTVPEYKAFEAMMKEELQLKTEEEYEDSDLSDSDSE